MYEILKNAASLRSAALLGGVHGGGTRTAPVQEYFLGNHEGDRGGVELACANLATHRLPEKFHLIIYFVKIVFSAGR